MGLKEAMEARKTATPTDDPDLGPGYDPEHNTYPLHDPMKQETWFEKLMAAFRDHARPDAPVAAKPIATPTASPTPYGDQRQ